MRERGELVCLKSDMHLSFRPKLWRVGMSAVYLFHQRMYSNRVHTDRPGQLDVALHRGPPSAAGGVRSSARGHSGFPAMAFGGEWRS